MALAKINNATNASNVIKHIYAITYTMLTNQTPMAK
jgi:hypothetical protein